MEDRRKSRSPGTDPLIHSAFRAAELGDRELLEAYLEALDRLQEKQPCAILVIVGCTDFAQLPPQVVEIAFDVAGSLVIEHCRVDDLACRYSDDCFAVVLTDVDEKTARRIAERYHEGISGFDWDSTYPGLHLNVRTDSFVFQPGAPAQRQLAAAFEELRATADESLKDSFYT
jgi:GGDEF domain-containing protein